MGCGMLQLITIVQSEKVKVPKFQAKIFNMKNCKKLHKNTYLLNRLKNKNKKISSNLCSWFYSVLFLISRSYLFSAEIIIIVNGYNFFHYHVTICGNLLSIEYFTTINFQLSMGTSPITRTIPLLEPYHYSANNERIDSKHGMFTFTVFVISFSPFLFQM